MLSDKLEKACFDSRKPLVKDDDDDLFAGLGSGGGEARKAANKANNSDFMSSLFGGSSSSSRGGAGRSGTSREFVLDEKYKSGPGGSSVGGAITTTSPAIDAAAVKQQPRGSRRGTPFIASSGTEYTYRKCTCFVTTMMSSYS